MREHLKVRNLTGEINMGTRATYQISSGIFDKQTVCFYIHWDGYPQGAAQYFWNMHSIKSNRGGYAGKFVRGNEYAEFTPSHNTHGDTEYRYSLDDEGNLTAWEGHNFGESWKVIYKGAWHEFVNQYYESETKLYLFNLKHSNSETVMALSEAKAYVEEKMSEASKNLIEGHIRNAEFTQEEAHHMGAQIKIIIDNLSSKPTLLDGK